MVYFELLSVLGFLELEVTKRLLIQWTALFSTSSTFFTGNFHGNKESYGTSRDTPAIA